MPANDSFGVPLIALLQRLANTHDDRQSGRQSRLSLATDHLVCIGIVLASLGMADNHMRAAGVAQHESSHLAGKRTFLLLSGTVLGRDLDVRTFQTIGDAPQSRKDRRNHNLAVVRVSGQRLQSDRRGDRIGHGLEHFPVSGDDRFAHDRVKNNHKDTKAQSC